MAPTAEEEAEHGCPQGFGRNVYTMVEPGPFHRMPPETPTLAAGARSALRRYFGCPRSGTALLNQFWRSGCVDLCNSADGFNLADTSKARN
jgi:hypothetical protein